MPSDPHCLSAAGTSTKREFARARALRALAAASLGLACFFGSGVASAQTPEARAQAATEFRAGVAAFAHQSWREALEHFQTAYRLAPHPSVRVNVANCYLQMGQPVEALTWFETYLREVEALPSSPREVERRAAVNRQMQELRLQIVEVRVRLEPERASRDAIFSVDGQASAIGNMLRMAPGRHVLEASAEGFQRERLEVALTAGSNREFTLTLRPVEAAPAPVPTPEPPPSPPTNGGAPPPSNAGTSPPPPVVVRPVPPVTPPPPPARGLSPLPFGITAGATGAFAIVWAATGGAALGANASFNSFALRNEQGQDLTQDEIDQAAAFARRARTLAAVSDTMMALTAAAGITSIVLLTQTRFAPRRESPAASLLLLPSPNGLVLAGGFR